MRNLTNMEAISYAGSVTSIAAAMTSADWGSIVGIVTALLTCAANLIYMARRDRREQRESDARLRRGK
ncbi:holin [uncultured Massilia sp.]|uniref:holin n=1 Tax=uncultured Massilia sp. TaxID=169973 RepID=UPI0025DE3EB7|nr:holin [uncultured Massilia sp.]